MTMFGGRLGWGELLLIAAVLLLILGPKKLPEFGRSFGEAIRSFKSSLGSASESEQSGRRTE
jgi:sec-independent protein translocase protein TatA